MTDYVRITLAHAQITDIVVPEKRVALTMTVASLKRTCASHFPTAAENMRLALRDDQGALVDADLEDARMLGYYQVKDNYTIVCSESSSASVSAAGPTGASIFGGGVASSQWSDVSRVEKFEISEEEYAKRGDNVRAFKEMMIARQRAQQAQDGTLPPEEPNDDSFKAEAETMKVDDRCQVSPGDRLGTVRFVGRIPGLKPGFWIGVEFDEPVGKGDGTVKGKQYFTARPNYGAFVRPQHVTVGDFPPEEF